MGKTGTNMVPDVFTIDIRSFLLGITVGMLTGFVAATVFRQRELQLQTTVCIFLFWVWVLMHVTAFFMDKEMPWMFDFIGFGATGSLAGLVAASGDTKKLMKEVVKASTEKLFKK